MARLIGVGGAEVRRPRCGDGYMGGGWDRDKMGRRGRRKVVEGMKEVLVVVSKGDSVASVV